MGSVGPDGASYDTGLDGFALIIFRLGRLMLILESALVSQVPFTNLGAGASRDALTSNFIDREHITSRLIWKIQLDLIMQMQQMTKLTN